MRNAEEAHASRVHVQLQQHTDKDACAAAAEQGQKRSLCAAYSNAHSGTHDSLYLGVDLLRGELYVHLHVCILAGPLTLYATMRSTWIPTADDGKAD